MCTILSQNRLNSLLFYGNMGIVEMGLRLKNRSMGASNIFQGLLVQAFFHILWKAVNR
nr:MAG TPA: hypothetical protein [Bacteriophage sp.]